MRLLLTLLACVGGGDSTDAVDDTGHTGDTAPPGPSAAFVGIAVRFPHGSLDSTCRVQLTLSNSGGGDVVDELELAARGGEWAGFTVPGGGTYVVSGNDADCTELSDELPYQSGAFSIADGQAGLWWWKGALEGIATVDEDEVWVRGRARVEADPGSPAEDLVAWAEAAGATATPAKDAVDTYELTFAEDLAVPALLATMSEYPRYVAGEPVWKSGAPSWW